MFQFCCQQMTDLNRKPYTIQMIQNDITLGKEAGSRKHCNLIFLPRDSQQISFTEVIKSISSQCPLLRFGFFSICFKNLAATGSLEIGGRSEKSHLPESTSPQRGGLTCMMMSRYRLWIKKFPKREMRTRCLFLNQSHPLELKRKLSCEFCTALAIRQLVHYSAASKLNASLPFCLSSLP